MPHESYPGVRPELVLDSYTSSLLSKMSQIVSNLLSLIIFCLIEQHFAKVAFLWILWGTHNGIAFLASQFQGMAGLTKL